VPNGRPGDHPYTDIIVHGFDYFTPEIDALVRELHAQGADHDPLADLLERYDRLSGRFDEAALLSELHEMESKL
jgi:hypothetical protein